MVRTFQVPRHEASVGRNQGRVCDLETAPPFGFPHRTGSVRVSTLHQSILPHKGGLDQDSQPNQRVSRMSLVKLGSCGGLVAEPTLRDRMIKPEERTHQ